MDAYLAPCVDLGDGIISGWFLLTMACELGAGCRFSPMLTVRTWVVAPCKRVIKSILKIILTESRPASSREMIRYQILIEQTHDVYAVTTTQWWQLKNRKTQPGFFCPCLNELQYFSVAQDHIVSLLLVNNRTKKEQLDNTRFEQCQLVWWLPISAACRS